MTEHALNPDAAPALEEVLRRYWGYDHFRPLQREAMQCVLDQRDSVVILPTGGGKSLCFQAPAAAMEGMAVVISPLISLMKDQVDALNACGIPAACIHSAMTGEERRRVHEAVCSESLRLLYVAPERAVTDRFIDYLAQRNVSTLVVDEAHCISQWGHDFRPEYRGLRVLREVFPDVAMHAYTATATPQVRGDIAEQLSLRDAQTLVGSFDRPNLIYRAERRNDRIGQICQVVQRFPNDAGIVYCISRKEVESVSEELNRRGYRSLPYHAGLDDDVRAANQEAFKRDKVRIIVATVAFGMGIDKPDVRYVVHSGMPKSIEHYQQESGRAGRDGLEAECWLFWAPSDFMLWKRITEQNGSDSPAAVEKLDAMYAFASTLACRRTALLEYFGEAYPKDNCQSCDFCLDEVESAGGSAEYAAHILACVDELGDMAGPTYTTLILTGSQEERVVNKRHHMLASHGTLADQDSRTVRQWIEHLVAQGFLVKEGEYNILRATARANQAGTDGVRLERPASRDKRAAAKKDMTGVDPALYEHLRALRRDIAEEPGAPAFTVFGDATLRDLARSRPTGMAGFLAIGGVGEKKARDYGEVFMKAIADYCRENDLQTDLGQPKKEGKSKAPSTGAESKAYALFDERREIVEVAKAVRKRPNTVLGYLVRYIQHRAIASPEPWASEHVFDQVKRAADREKVLSPRKIFLALDGDVEEAEVRICVACMKAANPGAEKD